MRWDDGLFSLLHLEIWRETLIGPLLISCFQAVIRQPRGSMKTPPRQPPPLNCCTHPANWNLTTGSRALSLKCRWVIETGECGITVGSDGWLATDALHYLNASVSISSQTLIWLLWICTSRCALLEEETVGTKRCSHFFSFSKTIKIKSISIKNWHHYATFTFIFITNHSWPNTVALVSEELLSDD